MCMCMINFEFEPYGLCKDYLPYATVNRADFSLIEKNSTNSTTTIKFEFLSSCCQEFMADFSVSHDTLYVFYENTNGLTCTCECWYQYILTINRKVDFEYFELEYREMNL